MNRSRSAFTLMEVAVAIMVLAIAVPATLATVAYAIREAGVLIRESTAAMTARSVLNQPGWGSDPKPINGYLATRAVESVELIASEDGSLTVEVDRVVVVITDDGHPVLTLSAYERKRR